MPAGRMRPICAAFEGHGDTGAHRTPRLLGEQMLRLLRRWSAAVLLAGAVSAGPAKADPSSVIFIGAGAAVAIIAGEVFQTGQPDSDRAYLSFGGGQFDVYRRARAAGYFHLEYRPPWSVWRFNPMIGAFATTHRAVAAYIGIGYDLHIGEHLVVNVNLAPTFYSAGRGKALGSFAVLRSGVELGYRFADGTRLMASFHHMSHGGLLNSKKNPGADTAALTLHIPVSVLERLLER